jgi:hypothetical protein
MKKGKTSKIHGFKTAKTIYGTVDSFELKSMYLNIQTWVEPKEELENWTRVVSNLSRAIRHSVYESVNTEIYDNKFIVDLDLRSSGLSKGKKSFLNLEVNLYLLDSTLDFKSKEIKDSLKEICKSIFKNNFSSNKYFSFHYSKTNKTKPITTQS